MYKSNIKLWILILSVGFSTACNNPKVKEGEKELSALIANDSEAGDNACLLAYAEKYDELFTLDDAVKVAGLAKAEAETDYNKALKNSAYHDIAYEWKSDRIKIVNVASMTIEIPAKNQIEIAGIEPRSIYEFKNAYRSVTDAELAETKKHLDKSMDEAYEGKSESKTANEAMGKVKEMGQSKKDVKVITENLQEGTFYKIAKSYQPVENLADAASWNSYEQCLYVLMKGAKVQITVDLSDDSNYNKEKAIVVAKIILAKCQ